jgi:glycosyltransferase involved in cell wall biosynthesis
MFGAQSKWISVQLGAREHYAVPRALNQRNGLDCLITDMWVFPDSLLAKMKRRVSGRYHPDLRNAVVKAANTNAFTFSLLAHMQGLNGWKLISERNEWFQRQALTWLARHKDVGRGKPLTLFAYSYAARSLIEFARTQRWRTILGQIDAGPQHENIVTGLYSQDPGHCTGQESVSPEYWDNWRSECALADCIIVNSKWSRDALLREGVSAEKLRVVPPAFEGMSEAVSFDRVYPTAFTSKQPMRVLFLGQINLGKGMGPLLEATNLLREEPVEFWFVGPIRMEVPNAFKKDARLHWTGPVTRDDAFKYYRTADVFILPTFSDGFGLTQLEAQAWKLPVVASRFCGEVVTDGINGILLNEISGEAIASVLVNVLQNPDTLRDMSARSGVDERFSLNALASSLLSL